MAKAKKPTAESGKPKPRTYSDQDRKALAEAICETIANGESMRKAVTEYDVPWSTFCRWVTEDASIAEQYARARDARAGVRADEIDHIAAQALSGEIKADVARVVIDAKKWAASKLGPKHWGDRVQAEISGPNGGPIETRSLDDAALKARIAALVAKNPALADVLKGTGAG